MLTSTPCIHWRFATRLKDWVRENGSTKVGDLVLGLTPAVSYDLDAQQIVQALLKRHLERGTIWPMNTITKASLERGLKKIKRYELLGEILAMASCKVTGKIGFIKVQEDS